MELGDKDSKGVYMPRRPEAIVLGNYQNHNHERAHMEVLLIDSTTYKKNHPPNFSCKFKEEVPKI